MIITEPDFPSPPEGILTPEEQETLTQLQQDRQDAAREERELLLAARARKPDDYHCPRLSKEFETISEGMTKREREGLSLFTKPDVIRWGEIAARGHQTMLAQYELFQAVRQRISRQKS
jgi:hypothetical protein